MHCLNYTLTMSALWQQNSLINRLYILQKKALRIINFEVIIIQHISFITQKLSKLQVKIENCPFINKYINNKLPSIFTNRFTFSSMSHNYQTPFTSKGNLQIPSVQTTYEKNAFVWL